VRYPKGGISLKSSQDTLLLQQVLRSRHVSHAQLWQFMQLKVREHRRRIFNWRVSRLVQHDLIARRDVTLQERMWVYSITQQGAQYLVGLGEGAALVASAAAKRREDSVVLHSLGLNEIHLALLRRGQLVRWKSELEVLSLNELTGYGYAKDYDAVVTVNSGGRDLSFGLEYERHPKASKRYWQVRQAIENEKQLGCFLYLTPSYDLLSYVAGFYERCASAVYFGLINELCESGLDARVVDSKRALAVPLGSILETAAR
jgi:hypothetical protein